MDPEIEKQIQAEIEQMQHFLVWRLRAISGEWPSKIRVNLFFEREPTEAGERMHVMEMETFFPKKTRENAEVSFLQAEKDSIVHEATKFTLRGGDPAGDPDPLDEK